MNLLCLGDSLMQQNPPETFPQAGWHEGLSEYLHDPEKDHVLNFALNGRSTKSFLDEGQYGKALDAASGGDAAIISFGHNDEKKGDATRYTIPFGRYQDNLLAMAQGFRKKNCDVLFVSSICRLKYDGKGKLLDTHGEYPRAMEEAARKIGADYLDLNKLTYEYLSEHPYSTDASFFMVCAPGEYPNYPDGLNDTSHLNIVGAKWICRLLMPKLKKISYLKGLFR
jgi:lysophospholipase L1-like esterase